MFYTDATIDFPANEVNKQLNTFNLRKKWEECLEKGHLIKEEDLGNGIRITIYYSYIKMPFIFSDRDMIMKKKLWENYQGQPNCCLIREHSITHPDYPPKEKPIRADFENGGQYVSPIDNYRTKFYFCSKFNMKLNIGISMIEREGAKGQAKWVKDFIKQLKK